MWLGLFRHCQFNRGIRLQWLIYRNASKKPPVKINIELDISEVLALPHVNDVSQKYNLVAASNVHYLDDSAAVRFRAKDKRNANPASTTA